MTHRLYRLTSQIMKAVNDKSGLDSILELLDILDPTSVEYTQTLSDLHDYTTRLGHLCNEYHQRHRQIVGNTSDNVIDELTLQHRLLQSMNNEYETLRRTHIAYGGTYTPLNPGEVD